MHQQRDAADDDDDVRPKPKRHRFVVQVCIYQFLSPAAHEVPGLRSERKT